MIQKFLTITLLVFLLAPNTLWANMDQRRAQLIGVIDEELREVTRINQQTNSNNPTLLLRMAELLLEKARLIEEQENNRFMALPPEQRRQTNRNKFFADSRKYFDQAQKTCEYILKRFRNFDEKGDVYYIMAYNAKEFNQLDKAKRFFNEAVRHTKPGTTARLRSQLALAEMHFNNNEYESAIPLYESALLARGVQRERWWTKDAYNLSWSYFRVNQVDKAINLMKQVHDLSGNTNFVDMSQSVERDLAYFYTEAGRANEAIGFFQKKGDGNVAQNLLRMGRNLIGQGKFAAAENTLLEALKQPISDDLRLEINVELIALYERFGKEEEHLRAAQVMHQAHKQGRLNSEQLAILKYQAARMAALLQNQVAGKTYERQPAVRKAKAMRSVAYFEIMSDINPETAHLSQFHSGETLYAIGDVNNSIKYYDAAVEGAQAKKDRKTFGLAVQGMMMSLAGKGVSQATESQYIEKAFRLHLIINPNDKQNSRIFQRLFNVYMDKNELANAEKTLLAYKQRYPREVETQEAMIAKIMEVHQKNKNAPELRRWVQRIENGEFTVSPQYLAQTKLLLLTMQFENVEKLNTEGEKKAALRGYLEIYKNDLSTADAKKNAAYNIASLFYELGDVELTYQWTMRALNEMNQADIEKYADTFLTLGSFFYNRRRFDKAAQVYEKSFGALCRTKNSNKELFYQNGLLMLLADNKYDQAITLVDSAYRCNIPNSRLMQSHLDILKMLADDGQWSSFADYIRKVERNRELWGELIFYLARFQSALIDLGRIPEAQSLDEKMMNFYGEARKKNYTIPLEGLDIIADIKLRGVQRHVSILRNIELSFPEERHTQGLKALFEQLDKLTVSALDMMDTKSGKGIINGYRILVESYDYVAAKVRGFTPPDRPPEYLTSFRTSMINLTEPMLQKSREFRSEALRQIQRGEILAENNLFFMKPTPESPDVRYRPVRGAQIMDRGGRQ